MIKRNRKAQIKFGESFAIIILVYVIIVAGMVWYNNNNEKKIYEMQQRDKMERAFEKYYYIINSDILHKSEQGDIDEEFDLISLRIFSNYTKNEINKDYIRRQIGECTIIVELVDKEFNSLENITLYNSTQTKFTNIESFKTLIPIYDITSKKTNMGKLTVLTYS